MEYFINFDYRDPLFGIVVLIFLIGVISILAYSWNYFLNKKQQEALHKFMESFDYVGFDRETKEFLALSSNPIPSLVFIAKMYQESANYEKAIRLYVMLLDYIKTSTDKVPIMESLGETYYKAGFPLRAKEIFLEILHHYPRNAKILKELMKVSFELGDYKGSLEALSCIEELEGGTSFICAFFEVKLLITSAKKDKESLLELLEISKKNLRLKRVVLPYLKTLHIGLFWEFVQELNRDELLEILDILWNLKKEDFIQSDFKEKILSDIFQAKGFLEFKAEKKEIFELEALCLIKQEGNYKADFKFNYQCLNCKGNNPLPFEFCPHCGELLNLKVQVNLKEKQDETSDSFL